MRTKNRTFIAGIALATVAAFPLAACSSSDGDDASSSASAPTALASIDGLTGEDTAVLLDQGFVDALTSLKVTPGVVGAAELTDGSLVFPITGGNVTYYDPASGVTPYVQGLINHDDSGLQLTGSNGKVVKLENFVVDPAESVLTGKVTVDGAVFAESAPLFFLDGRTLNPLEVNADAGTAVLEGTTVSLTKTAADALNMVFETDALAEFFTVGIAEITVDLPK